MRSLIIIEVEHGEDTDDLQGYVESMARNATLDSENMLVFKDYTVKVDLPECFVLEGGQDHPDDPCGNCGGDHDESDCPEHDDCDPAMCSIRGGDFD